MKVLISGSSGFIGTALRMRLAGDGHEIIRLVRRKSENENELEWNPDTGQLDNDFSSFDAVVNLSGQPIGKRLWTKAEKKRILDSRVSTTGVIARKIAEASNAGKAPQVLVNASAIGFYGVRGDEKVDETSTPGTTFLSGVVRAWEISAQPARDAGVRVVNIRTGLVLGKGGGLMKIWKPIFRIGLGGRMGSGDQWMSWVHIDDEVGAIVHALNDAQISGAINSVAPNPVKNTDFTNSFASALRRPALLPVPTRLVQAVAGRDLALEFTGSLFVEPKVLQQSGYQFAFPTLESALKDLT